MMEIDAPDAQQQTQIQVKFVTRDPEIAVAAAPILVPTK
jgi:hypothetical protein